MYNAALKRKWDAQNVLDYAVNTAKQEGKIEGKIEERAKAEAEKRISALALRKMGLPVPDIAKALGLSEDEVEQL